MRRNADVSDIPRSKYSTARFYFEILTVLCILQIVIAVVIFIAAFLSGQDNRWAIAPFVQLPRSTVMWLTLFAAFLGLGPLEDQVRIKNVAPRHLGHRNTGCSGLEAVRPLLLVCPKPPRPTRHAITIVSTIYGGHYQHLSPRGRAVRPDAYVSSAPRPDRRCPNRQTSGTSGCRWDGCRPPLTASQCAKVVVFNATQAEKTAR